MRKVYYYSALLLISITWLHLAHGQVQIGDIQQLELNDAHGNMRNLQSDVKLFYDESCYWQHCKEQVKKYSLYSKTCKETEQLDMNQIITKCTRVETDYERTSCENDSHFSLYTHPVFREFYYCASKNCGLIKVEEVCKKKIVKCALCQLSTSCSNIVKDKKYEIEQAVDPKNCTDADDTVCPDSLEIFAQQSCKKYATVQCQYKWMEKNIPEDDICYPICNATEELANQSAAPFFLFSVILSFIYLIL